MMFSSSRRYMFAVCFLRPKGGSYKKWCVGNKTSILGLNWLHYFSIVYGEGILSTLSSFTRGTGLRVTFCFRQLQKDLETKISLLSVRFCYFNLNRSYLLVYSRLFKIMLWIPNSIFKYLRYRNQEYLIFRIYSYPKFTRRELIL